MNYEWHNLYLWWGNYTEFIMLLVYFRKSNKQTPLGIPIIASIGSWLKFNFCLDIFGRMLLFNKISGCCSRALCFGLKSKFLTRVRAWFEKKILIAIFTRSLLWSTLAALGKYLFKCESITCFLDQNIEFFFIPDQVLHIGR